MDEKPIPREEPADPSQMGPNMDPTLRLLERMNVKLDGVISTQTTQGTMLSGVSEGLIAAVTRIAALEAKAPGSNPPPRTASGFNAAVRQISQSTESEPDKATAAQVVALQADVAAIKQEMGLQTKMLGQLVDAAGTFIKNPTVRRIAYVAGGLILGWLTHFAHQGIVK